MGEGRHIVRLYRSMDSREIKENRRRWTASAALHIVVPAIAAPHLSAHALDQQQRPPLGRSG